MDWHSDIRITEETALRMIKKEIEIILYKALAKLSLDAEGVLVEHSAGEGRGDYATSAAMVCAKTSGMPPRELAEKIKNMIESQGCPLIGKMDIAGPGFINFFLARQAIVDEAQRVFGEMHSGYEFKKGEKVNIEFISANPTGSLHIGHGRGAFYGDILSNVLAYAGADVTREYYINDSRESNQIKELGKTALGKGEQYKTEKLLALLKDVNVSGMDESEAGFTIAGKVQEANREFIDGKLGIRFDEWYSEDERLRKSGANDAMLARVEEFTYEKDGALWLKTTEYGDDEDRVLVRSNGTKGYFISDIAYHQDKFARGYDAVIDIWGADHHGHVKRMHAAGKMLGWPQEPAVQPIIFITQMVSLKEGDEVKKMSKRAGNVILLEDLVEEFGVDVVRWFFSDKALGTHMEFDTALAGEQSEKNPVYYVQYAHARIASVLARTRGLKADEAFSLVDVLMDPMARALALKVLQFPEIIEEVSRDYQVHKLTTYAYELARAFSHMYRDVRVVNDDTYNKAAADLMEIAQHTLAETLRLLGISAPEKM